MPVITVVARSKAKAGKESELESAVRAAVAPTHAEEGCLKYALHRAVDDPSLFTIVEKWTSKESLDRHLASKHIAELFSKLPALVAASPEIRIFEALPEGDPAKGIL
jgi:quinol monooxygenase YgiN